MTPNCIKNLTFYAKGLKVQEDLGFSLDKK